MVGIGWRVWRLAEEDGSAVLGAVSRHAIWLDKEMRARCEPPADPLDRRAWYRWRRLQPEHRSPSEICECGLTAYFDRVGALSDLTLGAGTLRVIGPVEIGDVTVMDAGFVRARALRMLGPLEFVGECGMGLDCDLPTQIDSSRGLRCVLHTTANAFDLDQHVWGLGRQLELRYQVEAVAAF